MANLAQPYTVQNLLPYKFQRNSNLNGLVRLREILFRNANSDVFETRIHWVKEVVFDSFQLIRINILVN